MLVASLLFAGGAAKAEMTASIGACGGKDIALYKWDIVALTEDPINRDPDINKHVLHEGSCQNLVRYHSAYYAFANADNAKAFAEDPEKYRGRIAFGGLCAMGFAGYPPKNVLPHATMAPSVVMFYKDRFYFQTDESKAELWQKDPDGNIERGLQHYADLDFAVRVSDRFVPAHPED